MMRRFRSCRFATVDRRLWSSLNKRWSTLTQVCFYTTLNQCRFYHRFWNQYWIDVFDPRSILINVDQYWFNKTSSGNTLINDYHRWFLYILSTLTKYWSDILFRINVGSSLIQRRSTSRSKNANSTAADSVIRPCTK